MKLFKRTAKEVDSAASLVPDQPKRKATSPSLGTLLPGLLAALIGVGAGGALLWFADSSSSQARQAELAQALGSNQAAAVQQALKQLQADSLAAARNPQLLQALQSGDSLQVSEAERSLGYWDGVIDAHLNRRGEAVQNTSRAAPMNFAGLDMLRRAESGQQPAVEAYRVGQRWLAYSAVALRIGENQPAQGTLLLAFDLQRLLATLPALPAEYGQVQLIQQFANTPAQVLVQRGQPGEGSAQTFSTGNPYWKISFIPGTALMQSSVPASMLGLALLLALGGAVIGLILVQGALQRRVNLDAGQLGQMLKELSAGKNVKAFSLSVPALDTLAQSLARLPRRSSPEGSSTPVKGTAAAPATQPAAKPAELVDPLFQDTDILDIDILDEDQDLLGLEQSPAMSTSQSAPKLPADIFRAYDIRGVVGDTLTAEYAYWIGRAIGSQSLAQGEPKVIVGRDGRLSGPELLQQLVQGLLDCGCDVTDIGMVPTPVVYFAANVLEGRSAVMLTGSHNPPDYNGFKIIIAGDTLANEQILALKTRLDNNDLASGVGSVQQVDVLQRYFKTIRDDIALAKPLRVVVDCGNGAAGVIAPQLIEALGCSVIPLFCEVDGTFPNHHPDPGKPENLVDLIARVKSENADLGLAFDGDGDRVGVVTNTGTIVYPDRLLMLFAKDVVSRNPGADIIFDVKCTRRLTPLISGYGGRPVMWKTGHSLIKKKMKETGALLAGEMSGHIFFKERWYGFDDGIYSAARLLEILSLEKRNAEQVFSAFPSDISTPEINIKVTEQTKFGMIERLQREGQWGEANITSIDGVRVDYPKGWGLIRASNTTPVLVLRFEADTQEELERIQDVFRTQLLKVAPDLQLPF
ncbi:phosphomannomutase/phosphoglucomutase [Ectopseudomonas mendocina]|uniref:Phosphomannomutase/phosphoglucomutase n=2 Tax=Ectopseudomonas mendocina TaxID=300 RepID=A0ABD7RVB9_ECTME|nr:phosphomannomutase/phosphoglucomutase [Pseudomonas mendocina]TRO17925.1 phosphomannomutase/phosphoglucomutase [Pseudomonas mendocina]